MSGKELRQIAFGFAGHKEGSDEAVPVQQFDGRRSAFDVIDQKNGRNRLSGVIGKSEIQFFHEKRQDVCFCQEAAWTSFPWERNFCSK